MADPSQGIFDGCNKTHPDINHAVVLDGYGSEMLGIGWEARFVAKKRLLGKKSVWEHSFVHQLGVFGDVLGSLLPES